MTSLGWVLSPGNGVRMRRPHGAQTRGMQLHTKELQRLLAAPRNEGEARGSPLEPPEGVQACQHLDSRLEAPEVLSL